MTSREISAKAKERLERARQRSVLICTPIARNPTWQYTASLSSTLLTLQEHGIRVSFQFVVGSSVICKARNELCAHFLLSDFTDMLFIDDDMEWSPTSVIRLLASDKPLIGGVGRMRVQKPNSDPTVWCWRPKHNSDGELNQDDMGAVEALGIGAAFMLINRHVLHEMATKHPEWKRKGADDWPEDLRDNYYEFFRQNDVGIDAEMSEDYVFCNRWSALGGSIWVDPTITLGHVGSWNYRGCVSETLVVSEVKKEESA